MDGSFGLSPYSHATVEIHADFLFNNFNLLTPPHGRLPVGYTVFPDELFQAPRHWVKHAYHNLIYFNEAEKGGHFAAWEEPEIFTNELRAAFRPLR